MKRIIICLGAIVLVFLTACGGGGGGGSTSGGVVDPGGGSTLIGGDFTADNPSPGANTTAMARRSVSGNLVTVSVNITDTSDIYAASFDVVYDGTRVDYTGWAAGTVLETGGHSPIYDIQDNGAGRLVVVAQRVGNVPTVDVVGTGLLIRLNFRVTQTGTSRLDFENANLSDNQIPPQNLPSITWSGGVLSGT
jgi:hypothetical protein